MQTIKQLLGAATLVALGHAGLAQAASPSYSYDQPTRCGTWCYDDPGLSKLTDGVSGYAGWAVNNAAPWVGWYQVDAVNITFQFSQAMRFSSVSIGSTQDYLGDVVIPNFELWAFQGGSWVSQGSIVNPASGANDHYLYDTGPHPIYTFSGLNVATDQLRITATPGVPGMWIFVDEVAFNAAPVPEPSSWAMLLAGLGIAGYAGRGRRRG